MPHDYYAFKRTELSDSMNALEQAVENLEYAKDAGDRTRRQQAENKIREAARRIVGIEPHLAYLLFESHGTDLGNIIRDTWSETLPAGTIPATLRLIPNLAGIFYLPPLSFALHIPFQLAKPYLSKDERDFYLLDAPLRKEKIFQAPMIASTSWKGALRAALWQQGHTKTEPVMLRLLGNPRGSEELQAGRLHFYPTFFEKIRLEVINPHERSTGVGRQRGPILMECVPEGESGDLFLLYVPFGAGDKTTAQAQVAEDLEVVAAGVQALLIAYGFGAKTSSGYGTARDRLAGDGLLVVQTDPTQRLPMVAALHCTTDGTPAIVKCTFNTLSELCELSKAIADQLRQGGTE